MEDRKQNKIKISNRYAALEISYESEDINKAWENKENIKPSAEDSLGLYELKQHNRILMKNVYDFRSKEQAKMLWLQDPNQNNVDNLENVRREVGRHVGNKKKEYLKAKIDELETNSKINILGTCIGASEGLPA